MASPASLLLQFRAWYLQLPACQITIATISLLQFRSCFVQLLLFFKAQSGHQLQQQRQQETLEVLCGQTRCSSCTRKVSLQTSPTNKKRRASCNTQHKAASSMLVGNCGNYEVINSWNKMMLQQRLYLNHCAGRATHVWLQ